MLRARRPMRRGFRSRLMAGFAAAFGVILLLSGLAGCGQIQVTTVSGAPEGPTIAIGVAADEPSVGAWHDGTYQGFDITIAKYVAAKLGYANKQIDRLQTGSPRKPALHAGQWTGRHGRRLLAYHR